MTRAKYQILVLPFRHVRGAEHEFASLRRTDSGIWQGIAGGGEANELPLDAAIREAIEEAGVPSDASFYELATTCSVPVCFFAERATWPADLFVIPEYAFAVDCSNLELVLSDEHSELVWDMYEETRQRLHWDSNRTALWELRERLSVASLGPPRRRVR